MQETTVDYEKCKTLSCLASIMVKKLQLLTFL